MRIRDFLALVHEEVGGALGKRMEGYASRQRFGTLQYYRGSGHVHYEVWAQRKTQRVEVGLHFEGARERNYAAAALLAERGGDVLERVGPDFELEEWTRDWTRLHRTYAAPALTPELASEAAGGVLLLMRGMQPLLEDLGIA